jgi:two-component system, OmpR family, phosphate regulon sensor histidine kinase PhoR
MLKLHQYFLLNYILLSLLTLFFSAGVSYFWLKNSEVSSIKDQLLKSVLMVDTLLEGKTNLDITMHNLEKNTGMRFTIISYEGVVLAESDGDKRKMDNHSRRPEVIMAHKDGIGEAIRHSATLDMDLLYLAKMSRYGGNIIYIRAAYPLAKVNEAFIDLWLRIMVIFFIGFVIAILASMIVGRKISGEIRYIAQSLSAISKKNYRIPEHEHFVVEFQSIGFFLKKLAARLRQRDKQKRKYDAKLRLKNRQQQEVLAALSHEFKNPIAVIQGYAQTLLDDKDMPVTLHDKFLHKIFNNSERLSLILDKLTLVTKMENGSLQLTRSEVAIKALITEVAHLLKDRYKNRQIEVVGDERTIEVDRTLIEMLFINLIENALKYSDDDIVINIDAQSIAVVDKGMGVSKDDIEKITKKFYRVSENSWNNSLGLGLSIVTYILNLHGSALEIVSEIEKGSTFRVTL